MFNLVIPTGSNLPGVTVDADGRLVAPAFRSTAVATYNPGGTIDRSTDTALLTAPGSYTLPAVGNGDQGLQVAIIAPFDGLFSLAPQGSSTIQGAGPSGAIVASPDAAWGPVRLEYAEANDIWVLVATGNQTPVVRGALVCPGGGTATLSGGDDMCVCETGGGACQVELDQATMSRGAVFEVVDGENNANTNNITVTVTAGGTIDGAASYVVNADSGAVRLRYIGSGEFVSI